MYTCSLVCCVRHGRRIIAAIVDEAGAAMYLDPTPCSIMDTEHINARGFAQYINTSCAPNRTTNCRFTQHVVQVANMSMVCIRLDMMFPVAGGRARASELWTGGGSTSTWAQAHDRRRDACKPSRLSFAPPAARDEQCLPPRHGIATLRNSGNSCFANSVLHAYAATGAGGRPQGHPMPQPQDDSRVAPPSAPLLFLDKSLMRAVAATTLGPSRNTPALHCSPVDAVQYLRHTILASDRGGCIISSNVTQQLQQDAEELLLTIISLLDTNLVKSSFLSPLAFKIRETVTRMECTCVSERTQTIHDSVTHLLQVPIPAHDRKERSSFSLETLLANALSPRTSTLRHTVELGQDECTLPESEQFAVCTTSLVSAPSVLIISLGRFRFEKYSKKV